MNVRYFFTAACGNIALGFAIFAAALPAAGAAHEKLTLAAVLQVDQTRVIAVREIDPDLTGHAEIDDLPAYLTNADVAE